ncbi:MAG TPA: tetratricopeptide repeat protein, partial [Longimicrobium sp.]|nr:tetratricopeptide repeat protein [Longimicrobium sp.]
MSSPRQTLNQELLSLPELKGEAVFHPPVAVPCSRRSPAFKGQRLIAWMMAVILGFSMESMAENARPAWMETASNGSTRPPKAMAVGNQVAEANMLLRQAVQFAEEGKYADAVELSSRALPLYEGGLGSTHPDVGICLSVLGVSLVRHGQPSRAEPFLRRALAISEAALGKDHPGIASSLDLLAELYRTQGLYDRAEPLYQRVLAIREAALGQNHPDVATSLNNLAVLYKARGWYDRAEPLFQRALAIEEAALGKSHPSVATSLNNLATLYQDRGWYDRAEPLHQRALAIQEGALGKNHPDVAVSLNCLAVLHKVRGLYDQAEPLYQRALAIREAALGENHPGVAVSLHNLAGLYETRGLYDQAEPLLQRALAISEAALGKNHPDVANSLTNLASLYEAQGLYDQAEPLHQRALAIREAALDKNHPDVAMTLSSLGVLRVAQHRLADALPLFNRAFTLSESRLRLEALAFSGSRLEGFLQFIRRVFADDVYSLLRAHPDDAGVRRLALTATLLLKGRSAEEAADISRAVYQSLAAEDRGSFQRLRGLRTELAKLSLDGPGKLAIADYKQRLKSLSAQGDALEASLAKRSAPLRALTALPSADDVVDRVAASLPRDGALVDLLVYLDVPLIPSPGASGSETPRPLRYLALVLFPDGRTRAVDLGPAAPIDAAAARLRDALASRDASYQA